MYSIIRHREGQVVNRMELKMSRRRRMQDVLVGLGIDPKLEGILAVNSELGEENVELEDGDQVSIIPAVAGGLVLILIYFNGKTGEYFRERLSL